MGDWTTTITPKTRLWSLDFKEVWSKKFLLWLFVKRDITVQFKQTVFGFAWYFISPLITTVTYFLAFGKIAGISTGDVPEPLFYLSGICLWNYFSQAFSKITSTFLNNAGLFGKVFFPRLVVPFSLVISCLFRFIIQLALFVAVYFVFQLKGCPLRPNAYVILVPFLVAIIGGLAMGVGLINTSFSTKYKDFYNLFSISLTLWMYATPIVYPLTITDKPWLRFVMNLNPVTPVVEAFRYGFFGIGEFSWATLAYSFCFMSVTLILGMLAFNRRQVSFIDTI